jgi:hypothetical protein
MHNHILHLVAITSSFNWKTSLLVVVVVLLLYPATGEVLDIFFKWLHVNVFAQFLVQEVVWEWLHTKDILLYKMVTMYKFIHSKYYHYV